MLALEGEFDLAAAPTVRERLADAVLSAQGARLVLAALRPAVIRLLELTRTTGLLTVAPTLEEALRRAAAPQIGSGLGSGGSGRGSGTGVGGAGSGPGEGSGPGIGGSG